MQSIENFSLNISFISSRLVLISLVIVSNCLGKDKEPKLLD
jgi:hypothetical protein